MYVVCSLLLVSGLFLLYKSSFKSPSAACNNAVAKNKAYGLLGKAEQLVNLIAIRLIPFISLSQNQNKKYARMLQAKGEHVTPEYFFAKQAAFVVIMLGIGMLLIFRSALLPVLFGLVGIFVFFNSVSELKENYQRYQTEVEMDLPKLCSVINSRLSSTKNVQSILTSFLPIANPAMQKEIKLTLNDMKTGSQQIALMRMETRLGSGRVSDVVRGLISVLNGDNQEIYFQSKQNQLNSDYLTVRRKEISQRPMKLMIPELLAFLFFFVMMMYPAGVNLLDSMQGIM